jgi:cyclohexa-1,5-dienecarbonyl-CoA hydratase
MNSISSTDLISLELKDKIAWFTINRPPLNILDLPVLRQFDRLLNTSEIHEKSQVLVIRGAGEKAFSAGVDIKDHAVNKVSETLPLFHQILVKLKNFPITTLAAVHGMALGGGLELAMACDLVIAETGTKLGQPEINAGCFPPAAAALLPDLIGAKRTYEMVVLGSILTAEQGFQYGIVNEVVPVGKLMDKVNEWCEKILEKSKVVVGLAKEAVNFSTGLSFSSALENAEDLYLNRLTKTEDSEEGIRAFLEKRKPIWKGC